MGSWLEGLTQFAGQGGGGVGRGRMGGFAVRGERESASGTGMEMHFSCDQPDLYAYVYFLCDPVHYML